MDRTRTVLCWIYYALAGIALVATQKQNATVSISVDLLVFAVAGMLWMLYEARRLSIRFIWVYLVLSIFIAISVTFPIFLAVRERRLWALQAPHQQGKPGVVELIAFAILGIATLAGVIYAATL